MASLREKIKQSKSKLSAPPEEIPQHPADLEIYRDGGFYQIRVDLIQPNPHQPRKFFDPEKLEELSGSIKEKGVLQPVLIRRDETGLIFLVAGERRWRAAKMAGLSRVPCILTSGNPVEISLIENLQRDNLKPLEEAEALQRMLHEYQYTQEQVASAIGKAQSTISEILGLNRLPEEIKEEIRNTDVYPRRLLVEVSRQATPEKMLGLFRQARDGRLKSDQVREIKREGRSPEGKSRRAAAFTLVKEARRLKKKLLELDARSVPEEQRPRLLGELEELGDALEALKAALEPSRPLE